MDRPISNLVDKKCVPCHAGVPRLSKGQIESLLSQLPSWEVQEEKFLVRQHKTNDFKSALTLANKIGAIAEQEGHHPDLLISWGVLGIKIWTHATDGLTENDFILAAKIDRVTQLQP